MPRKFGVKGNARKRAMGVKAHHETSSPQVPSVSRSFGVKNPVPRGGSKGIESCPTNCPGEWLEGMWIHSSDCRWASMLWRSHGKTADDWQCPYECPPIELSSGWTHPYTCPFWDRTGRTPFDHNAPADVPPRNPVPPTVPSVRKTSRRFGARKLAGQRLNFEDLPDMGDIGDDDLPF